LFALLRGASEHSFENGQASEQTKTTMFDKKTRLCAEALCSKANKAVLKMDKIGLFALL